MTVETVVTSKAVVAGGISVGIATVLGSTEIMSLIAIGSVASLLSFFYDWAHSHPRVFGLIEVSEILKYVLYGISMMFIVFYACIHNCTVYLEMPKTAWGMVATISAGSAVSIVDFIIPKLKELATKALGKVK